jgi:hypothetical protein
MNSKINDIGFTKCIEHKHHKYLIFEIDKDLVFFDKKTFQVRKAIQQSSYMKFGIVFDWDETTRTMNIKYVQRRDRIVKNFHIIIKVGRDWEIIEYEEPLLGNWWSKEVMDTPNPYDNLDFSQISESLDRIQIRFKDVFWSRANPKLDVNYMPEFKMVMGIKKQLNLIMDLSTPEHIKEAKKKIFEI